MHLSLKGIKMNLNKKKLAFEIVFISDIFISWNKHNSSFNLNENLCDE
jgi:hypothetical protein